MKKILFSLFFIFATFAATAQQHAKYVFFFIGDGMGLNQINLVETYESALDGHVGAKPLFFAQFPYVGYITTFSAFNEVTDSAAAGTALATGSKTKNGSIGVDTSLNKLTTIAERAKSAGAKVGITTSVAIDNATPAAFYAHQASRRMQYEIALDITHSNFDFFAGAGFASPEKYYDKSPAPSIFPILEKAGYKIVKGYNECKNALKSSNKIIMMNNEGQSQYGLEYKIDRKAGDLSLPQITECAINALTQNNKNGFFLMVEGGQIDWAAHANDAATVIADIYDMNDAIKLAYNFYTQHPDETLIVITADHDTGGLGLGAGKYETSLELLQHQTISQSKLSERIANLRKEKNNNVEWNEIKKLISESIGLWSKVEVSTKQEKEIYEAYENSFIKGNNDKEKSLYQEDEKIAAAARKALNKAAGVSWAHNSHTANYVPVFAIGVGAENFSGKMDNTDIPKKIAKIANY